MHKRVVVVISSYNGSEHIIRQLESVFLQENVDVMVYIRDDNSKDDTVNLVKQYSDEAHREISIIQGENLGYARSFWEALKAAPEADYYAFADQDDVWNCDKLFKCISVFDENNSIPQLSYCRMTRTTPDLTPLEEQVNVLNPSQLNKKLVLTQTYNYGAATVINKSAKDLCCRYFPKSGLVPHDAWVGVLCYWFGKVFYVDESLYSWIRYESSVTGEGTKASGVVFRMRQTLMGKSYYNMAGDILNNYSDLLENEDKQFLELLLSYKNSFGKKRKLLLDRELRRSSICGTIMLKLGILLNKF